MISIPLKTNDPRKEILFPSALSDAFAYDNIYVTKDTLSNGIGYWLKFDSPQNIPITGSRITSNTVIVQEGWNLIGSISDPVLTSEIISIPPSIITSDFFEYASSYFSTDTLLPSTGYWVKTNMAGSLLLTTDVTKLTENRIIISPTSELPPSPPSGDSKINQPLPKDFSLEQNYPNPFNPATIFKYALPYDSKVILRIYNTLGQVVMRLVDNVESAGFKSVEWNASHMASGVYFYRLEATNINDPGKSFIHVRKMLLIK
jgi:hypothetical protein